MGIDSLRRAWPLAVAVTTLSLAATGVGATPRLAYSTASNRVVQPQPKPGTCHATGTGPYSRPDPRCTPGALNPAVTQADIGRTICHSGWTATVRPSESITEAEKRASMLAYSDTGPLGEYEYDHFVPLELGGATNAPANLWPEPGASPNRKDRVENELNRAVCEHRIALAKAQEEIAGNWVKLARHGVSLPPVHEAGWCSASASWSSQYGDYDIYVHSDQPDRWARVTGAGTTAGYHTNHSGYADVYFHAPRSDAGDEVYVQVGTAHCSATL